MFVEVKFFPLRLGEIMSNLPKRLSWNLRAHWRNGRHNFIKLFFWEGNGALLFFVFCDADAMLMILVLGINGYGFSYWNEFLMDAQLTKLVCWATKYMMIIFYIFYMCEMKILMPTHPWLTGISTSVSHITHVPKNQSLNPDIGSVTPGQYADLAQNKMKIFTNEYQIKLYV